MICLEINTSKTGKLWPSQYWKVLIDALFVKGSKINPLNKYRDLKSSINNCVEIRNNRHYITRLQGQAIGDDNILKIIKIKRIKEDKEKLLLPDLLLPNTDEWLYLQVPFLGTIGNREYEYQTKLNQNHILNSLEE